MQVSTKKSGVIDCTLVLENKKTVWVKLSDGKIIKRHKDKHKVVK